MPKTSRRPQRQAVVAWSSSSDDDESLPYSRAAAPLPRGRALSRKSSSSSRPTKTVKRLSRKGTSKKKIVIETNWNDDSSSNEEEASRTHETSKNTKRRILDRAAPQSLPAFTPIVPKKKRARKSSDTTPPPQSRAPIRVNLTPDPPTDMPKGWLTKSGLLNVSSSHNGMAIQYRVMYHSSQKPIRDGNTGATGKIRYREMVVQSRYACVSGSHGGSTYSFMRWKLPGTLLQSRNAKHITIYQDTRPRLPSASRKETDYPLIILCNELKGRDRCMAERFLRDAQAGMTPEQFYSDRKDCGHDSKETDATHQDDKDSPLVSQDDEEGHLGGYVSERENESPPRSLVSADKEKSRRDKRQFKPSGRPLGDQNSKSTISSKRRHNEDDDAGTTAKRAKKRDYGGARNRRKSNSKVTFQIGETDPVSSAHSQCMALIEGVVGTKSGRTGGPDEKAEDFIRDVFMNGREEKLPSSGRMIELPSAAKPGTWIVELVDTNKGGSSSLKGIMRDKFGNLKDVRISFRHENYSSLGPLQLSRSGSVASPTLYSPRHLESRIRGGGVSPSNKKRDRDHGTFTVSLIDPTHGRRHDLLAQGIVCKETLDRSTVVGSISIVGFEGFTSAADARISAAEKSAYLLQSCRKKATEMEANGTSRNDYLEGLLPIPAPDEDLHNIGTSFVCKVGLDDSYGLLVAHDEEGHVVGGDVVFDKSLFDNRSSLSSTSSLSPHIEPRTRTPRLSERVLLRHSNDMEKRTDDYDDDDDSAGMILDDDVETPSLPESPPSAAGAAREIMNSDESIDDHERAKAKSAVVTIDPMPLYTRHVPTVSSGTSTAAPKSILKKKSTLFREVTPAPLLAKEAKQHKEALSSDDFMDGPSIPFVTPTLERGRQNRAKSAGFLTKLDQVTDVAVDGGNTKQNGAEEEEEEDDVFEDPVNENVEEIFGLWGDRRDGDICNALPSVTTTILHDHDNDTIPSHIPKSAIRRKPFSAARILFVAFVLWQASLVPPNDKDGLLRRAIPRRSCATVALPFANDVKSGDTASLLAEQKQVVGPQSWLASKLW